MFSIFATTERINEIHEIIASEDRLSELIEVVDSMEKVPESSGNCLIVNAKGILPPIDWHNVSPPYLLANPLPFSKEVLLGLVFSKLGNGEKGWEYLEQYPVMQFETGLMTRLQFGYQIELQELVELRKAITGSDFDQYRMAHNDAIIRHYGFLDQQVSFEEVQKHYEQALELAPNVEYQAFTTKHYATLLLDVEELAKATQLLETTIEAAISEDAKYGLKAVLTSIWMKQLTVPYDTNLLANLKDTLWEVLQYFEKNNRPVEAGLLYVDAAHIANISESFSESLGYITKAIRLFEEEEMHELAANAHLRKGTLLYTWAQNGNPQFYKPSIEAYQQALKTFTQEETPDVFADIHHNLAILYAEMPAENKKRGIWAGISAASFQEALNFYGKESHPYEYGMICNNFGNALMKFPPAIHSDNYDKALFYYNEALSVRSSNYPYERSITLLNYLEASWNVSNAEEDFNQERFNDMVAKANEVKQLVQETSMLEEADRHLDLLQKLRETVAAQ